MLNICRTGAFEYEYTLIVCRKIKTIKQTAKQNDDKSYQGQVRAQSQNEHIFEARNINASENVVTGLSFTYDGLRRCTWLSRAITELNEAIPSAIQHHYSREWYKRQTLIADRRD